MRLLLHPGEPPTWRTSKSLFRSAAREKILRGATQLADAVRITLGPKSKSVLIQKSWGAPIVCNDGVTIAKEFDLPGRGRESRRTDAAPSGREDRRAGRRRHQHRDDPGARDLRRWIAQCHRGASAIDLKRGLDRGLKAAVEALKAQSRPVVSRKEKAQVGTISAHNDETIGELVAEAMEKVGGEGVITVEESKTTETVLEVVEGMQFDRGSCPPISLPTRRRWRRSSKTLCCCSPIARSTS